MATGLTLFALACGEEEKENPFLYCTNKVDSSLRDRLLAKEAPGCVLNPFECKGQPINIETYCDGFLRGYSGKILQCLEQYDPNNWESCYLSDTDTHEKITEERANKICIEQNEHASPWETHPFNEKIEISCERKRN